MGADLVLASVVVKTDENLPWNDRELAMKKAVKELPAKKTIEWATDFAEYQCLEDDFGEDGTLSEDDARRLLECIVDEFFRGVDSRFGGSARDITHVEVGDRRVILSGGMSWGDPPTESFDCINNVDWLPPEVLEAGGFE